MRAFLSACLLLAAGSVPSFGQGMRSDPPGLVAGAQPAETFRAEPGRALVPLSPSFTYALAGGSPNCQRGTSIVQTLDVLRTIGTLPLEACAIAMRIAPGLSRRFAMTPSKPLRSASAKNLVPSPLR